MDAQNGDVTRPPVTWDELKALAQRAGPRTRSTPRRFGLSSYQCAKKVYPSRTSAASAARLMRRAGERLHPYVCEQCGQWHVGHAMSKRKRSRRG